MTPEQFCYWLQGRAELQPDIPLSDAEWKSVREHLATVFKKVTPQVGPNIASPALPPSFPSAPSWPYDRRGIINTMYPGLTTTVTC